MRNSDDDEFYAATGERSAGERECNLQLLVIRSMSSVILLIGKPLSRPRRRGRSAIQQAPDLTKIIRSVDDDDDDAVAFAESKAAASPAGGPTVDSRSCWANTPNQPNGRNVADLVSSPVYQVTADRRR